MKRIIFLMGILLPLLGYCQNSDTSRHSRFLTTSPRLGGINVSYSVTPINTNGNTLTLRQPIVDIGIPVYKDFSTVHAVMVKTGIRYQGLFLSNGDNIGSIDFHSLSVPLLMSYSLSRSTSISFVGLATVASDFKQNIEAGDILYVAGVRLGVRPGKNLRYGVTLTYISNYSGKYLLPIPDIDWTISNRWIFTGVIPARATLRYKLTEAQSFGITGAFDGSMYRLNQSDQPQYLHLRQNNAGLIYDVKLDKWWKLTLVAGHTFMQKLETFNMDQKVPFDGFNKLNERVANVSYRQNSFIFQAGFNYEF